VLLGYCFLFPHNWLVLKFLGYLDGLLYQFHSQSNTHLSSIYLVILYGNNYWLLNKVCSQIPTLRTSNLNVI
jgi:hypothetical protein